MRMFQVDAFTDRLFSGNPAAVLILDDWLSDELMLAIAQETTSPRRLLSELVQTVLGICVGSLQRMKSIFVVMRLLPLHMCCLRRALATN